jgi:hypothetical protein
MSELAGRADMLCPTNFGSFVPEAEVNAFQGHQAWFCFDHSRHLGYVPSRVRI